MVGATIAVCLLVAFLVALALYYAYVQGYFCNRAKSRARKKSTTRRPTNDDSAMQGSTTAEQLRLATSQNSSQLELMSDLEGADDDRMVGVVSARL